MSVEKHQRPADWQKDADVDFCTTCNRSFGQYFGLALRRHHCRNCGKIFCADCTRDRAPIPNKSYNEPVRVCSQCFFSLSKMGKASNQIVMLKRQIQAMEEVSQALMTENKELRRLTDSYERLKVEQDAIVATLWNQDELNQKENKIMRAQLDNTATPGATSLQHRGAGSGSVDENKQQEVDQLVEQLDYAQVKIQWLESLVENLRREKKSSSSKTASKGSGTSPASAPRGSRLDAH